MQQAHHQRAAEGYENTPAATRSRFRNRRSVFLRCANALDQVECESESSPPCLEAYGPECFAGDGPEVTEPCRP